METSKPKIIDDYDLIVKITRTTICSTMSTSCTESWCRLKRVISTGADFCCMVEAFGPAVTHMKPGQRVVNSFSISCGECEYCKKKLTTACEKTNASRLPEKLMADRWVAFSDTLTSVVTMPVGRQSMSGFR